MTTTARPATPTDAEIVATINTLTHELLASVRSYRQAKATFNERSAYHQRRHGGDTVEADWDANADALRQNAAADAQWFASDVTVAAHAITALCRVLGRA